MTYAYQTYNRTDAVIEIVERRALALEANERQRRMSCALAAHMLNYGESGHRAIQVGVSTCKMFIEQNINDPTIANCNVVPINRRRWKK